MKKLFTFLMCTLFSAVVIYAQKTVTGIISDANNHETLVGASVVGKGTTVGTISDIDGKFSIVVPKDVNTLMISFTGYVAQEVDVTNVTNLTVVLQPDTKVLDEVVVGAFGTKLSARSIGASVATLKNSEITASAPVSLASALSGKVSGVQINVVNNGVNPGVAMTFRGNRSFLGNNQALLVVDGVITPLDFLAALNPNDVEKTTILKGPNAAALYGSDASNGVLIVTLKKGAGSLTKPTITYSYSLQAEQLSYMPGLQNQFSSYGGEGAPFLDKNGYPLYTPFENQSFGPAYSTLSGNQPLGYGVQVKQADGSIKLDTLKVPFTGGTPDNRRAFFNTGVTSQHDLAFRLGNDDDYFGISLQRVDKTGIVPNDAYNRTGVNVKGGKKIDRFSVNYGLNYIYTNSNIAGADYAQGRPVYWNVLNTAAHVPLRDPRIVDIHSPYGDVNGYFNAYEANPWWQVSEDNSRINNSSNALRGSADLSYKILDWLSALYRVGGSYSGFSVKSHVADVTFSDYAISDPWGAGNLPSSYVHKSGTVTDIAGYGARATGDFLVTVNPIFGDFTTDLTLGHHAQLDVSNFQFEQANALKIPGLYNISNRIGEATVAQGETKSTLSGLFADVTLGYKKFAFIHASGRNDATSVLSPANRNYFYSSIDGSIILTDMIPALKDLKGLEYLKIRGGIAKVGNVNVAPYQLQNVYSPGNGFPFGGQSGLTQSSVQNDPNLKPEFTLSREVGIEAGFGGRFEFEATYYRTNTTNQTVPINVSNATGYTTARLNTGEMQGEGYDVDLKIRPIVKVGSFSWEAGVNYSYNNTTVLSLYQDLAKLNISQFNINNGVNFTFLNGSQGAASSTFAAIGYSYPALYLTDVQRDPEGRVIINPATGYPITDPNQKYVGSTQPHHRLGISNTLSVGPVSLFFLFEYRGGAVIYNQLGNALDFTGVGINSASNGRQNFVFPNSVIKNADGTYTPNSSYSTRDGNLEFWTNSAWHTNAATYVNSSDFWKLREVSLSYNLPTSLLSKTGVIKSVILALTGRNLLMWRPKTNVYTDPEFSNDASNAAGTTNENQTPPTRIFGLKATVGF